ncbi:hypothetical protein HanRHA438_Chr15g0691761 [Helianthus annuus]|nr:hypothetical protein HanRHA438_Chr15g0691761 [Helianthus annuus]
MDEDSQSSEEGEEFGNESEWEMGNDGLPIWIKPRRLSTFPEEYRARMYTKKINKSTQGKKKLFLCERVIDIESFDRFGIVECFRRLGWTDFLQFKGIDDIYTDHILEWMSTLKKDDGDNPPLTTRLIGIVDDEEVVLSFAEMKKLAKYDTKATNRGQYVYPSNDTIEVKKKKEKKWQNEGEWREWIQNLFDLPPNINMTRLSKLKLYKKNLHALPTILFWVIITNVMPCTSDKNKVRLFEVMILYALLKGTPKLSAHHLILYNIWEAREREGRLMIPHARLLSKMLFQAGVIPNGARGFKLKAIPVDIDKFTRTSVWNYAKTRTKHVLFLSEEKFIKAARSDIEEDEEEEEEEGEDEEEAVERLEGADRGVPLPVTGPVVMGLPPEMRGSPYYEYLHKSMVEARPGEFSEWSSCDRFMFDRQAQQIEEGRVFQQSMIYRQEQIRNEEWEYRDQIRREQDFIRGYEPAVRPRPTDWSSSLIQPYAATQRLPRYPQATPSPYISPYHQQQEQGASGQVSQNSYDVGALQRSYYEFSLGRPYTPPEYDGESTL